MSEYLHHKRTISKNKKKIKLNTLQHGKAKLVAYATVAQQDMSCIHPSRVVQETVRISNMTEETRRIGEEAKSLAHDIVSYHTGKVSPPPNQTAAILRRLTDELEDRHSAVLSNMCNRLNVVSGSAQSKFVQVADEVFRDGVNWGRIVAIFAFGAKLAQYCMRNGLQEDVDEIILWVGNYISSLSAWIHSQGGWVSLPNQD